MFRKFKCMYFGKHDMKLRHSIIGEYTQTFTWDEEGDCGKIYYDLYFYECPNCKSRRVDVVGGKKTTFWGGWEKHHGIMRIREKWLKHLI